MKKNAMMRGKKRKLSVAICMAIASMGVVATAYAAAASQVTENKAHEEIPEYHLGETVVLGRRYIAGEYVLATSNIGILGQQDVMSSPISVISLSEKAVDDYMSSTEGLSKMLSLVPSVQKTYDAAVDCVNIRGFADDGRGFSINGIPGMQAMTRQSTDYIDSVDVIEGPSTGITGSNQKITDGGTININSKKALDKPSNTAGLKFHSKGSFEETIDISRRFGKDARYGIRINAANVNGQRSINNWALNQKNIYVDLDQRSDKSKTNFLFGYTDTDSQGRPYGLSVNSKYIGESLPDAPDGEINFNPRWRRDKNTNLVATLNHDQKINDHLHAFLNAGHFKQDWYYYVGFSKTLLNENGDYSATSDNYSLIEKRDYLQLGLRGDFKTGDLKHEYTFGVDRMWHYYGGASDYEEESGWTGNIYSGDPGNWAEPTFDQSDAYYGTRTRVSGWSVADSVTTGNKKLNVLVGLNGKSIKKDSYNSAGEHTKVAGHYNDVSPFFGINYTFDPHIAVYANHTEQFVEGSIVGSGYTNKGDTLDPYKTKQNEIGVKFKTGDFLHKLSYFDIKKANSVDIFNDDGTKTLGTDGERRHKGIEYTATGTLAKKWNLIGGFMHLNTEQRTNSSATNGKRPNGVPDWTASLGAEYEASDKFSALLRGNYVGSSYVLNETYKVPSFFTMDLGFKYKTKFESLPVKLSAMCYNVFNKSYWNASGNTLHLGGPRTFMVSAEFEF